MKIVKYVLFAFAGLFVIGLFLPKPDKPESKPAVPTSMPSATPTAAAKPAATSVTIAKPENWLYSNDTDAMDRKQFFASATSTNKLNFAFPYQGEQNARLLLRRDHRGLNVIVGVEKGQFLCTAYDGCTVSVKFGDKAIQQYSASPSDSMNSTVLFISNAQRFFAAMKGSSKVVIEPTFYQHGSIPLVFEIAGFDESKFK